MEQKIPWWWLPADYTVHGAGVDRLITVLHWFMAVLFVGWGIFYVYCLVRFRYREGAKAHYAPVEAKASKYAEIGVLAFEVFLLLGLSMPIWAKYKNEPPTADQNPVTVRVVAEQFAWNFHYPGKDGKFGRTSPELIDAGTNPIGLDPEDPNGKDDFSTLNHLHVPVGRPVIARISSKDVIHSFGVHGLRVKQDAVPGMEVPIWFTVKEKPPAPLEEGKGHFEVACSQLCGIGHYRMGAQVFVDTPEEFQKFLDENAPPQEESAAEPAPEAAPADAASEGGTP